MTDYLNESRCAVAIIRALRAGDVSQAEEIARLVDDDSKYVAALQALALQFLKVIDVLAARTDAPDRNADALLTALSDQMAIANSIELPDSVS